MTETMKRFTFQLPKTIFDELKLIAFYNGDSIASTICKAIKEYKRNYEVEIKIRNLKKI